jgi:hypothetical protein
MDIYFVLSSLPHNTHHLKRYVRFVQDCVNHNQNLSDVYVEKHHICPKSLFPQYSNIKLNLWNSCVLTARQHFIAHWILSKVYAGGPMHFALQRMINSTSKRCKGEELKIKTSKSYEIFRSQLISHLSETTKKQFKEKGHPRGMLGKKHSVESCRLMSENRKGELNGMYGKIRNDLSEINKDPILKMKKGYSKSVSTNKMLFDFFQINTTQHTDPLLVLRKRLLSYIDEVDAFRYRRGGKFIHFSKLEEYMKIPSSKIYGFLHSGVRHWDSL